MTAMYSRLIALVLVAGLGATGRVEAVQPSHQDLQNQIDSIPPAWSRTLPAAQRFVLVLGDAAVLDKETGLVWERAPDTNPGAWMAAQSSCNGKALGGRLGWRLPTLQELASLIDQTQSQPSLPSGHPFSNIQTGPTSNYWSASTIAGNTGFAWAVWVGSGVVVFADKTNNTLFAWCARSGHPGPDGQ